MLTEPALTLNSAQPFLSTKDAFIYVSKIINTIFTSEIFPSSICFVPKLPLEISTAEPEFKYSLSPALYTIWVIKEIPLLGILQKIRLPFGNLIYTKII